MPQPVTALAGVRIATVAAGVSYTLAVSEAGEVFSFGTGEFGRLGHGDELDVELPKQIEALRGVDVLTVAAGGAHAKALTRSGEVYSWGYGSSGQLGHGLLNTNTTAPAIIEALRGVRVERIAAGEAHSCAASQAGHLYTWGCGISGKLDHGVVYGLVHKSSSQVNTHSRRSCRAASHPRPMGRCRSHVCPEQ
jgi:hypothetical protein